MRHTNSAGPASICCCYSCLLHWWCEVSSTWCHCQGSCLNTRWCYMQGWRAARRLPALQLTAGKMKQAPVASQSTVSEPCPGFDSEPWRSCGRKEFGRDTRVPDLLAAYPCASCCEHLHAMPTARTRPIGVACSWFSCPGVCERLCALTKLPAPDVHTTHCSALHRCIIAS
jgi:hypothetical protein